MAYLAGVEGGVEKNEAEARTWLERGAQNDPQAQFVLGILFLGDKWKVFVVFCI